MQPVKEYTFDNFIVGKSNQFAFTAAKAAAEKPGLVYNPLFIFGESGLGKTHLLNAIYNHIHASSPNAVVFMLSAAELTMEMVKAVKTKQMNEWHKKMRSADVLLIDDAQLLMGKSGTQAELVSLLRSCVQEKRQVVMTASAAPERLPVLKSSLRSDFDRCLLADIQPLDTETCKLIARDKAARCGLRLSEEALNCISSHANGEARRLEGLINHALAEESLMIGRYPLQDADSLRSFIERYQDSIVGHELTAYRCAVDEGITDEPMVLSFDRLSFVIEYYYDNELSIQVVDTALVKEDPTLHFLNRDLPGKRNVCHGCPEWKDHPYIRKKAEDIRFVVERDGSIRDLLFRFEGDRVLFVRPYDFDENRGLMEIHREIIPRNPGDGFYLRTGLKV